MQRSCAACREQLVVPAGFTAFTCPNCNTSQTPGGVILNSTSAVGTTKRTQPTVPESPTPTPSRLPPDFGEEYIERPENLLTNVSQGEEGQAPVGQQPPLDGGVAPAGDYESMPSLSTVNEAA